MSANLEAEKPAEADKKADAAKKATTRKPRAKPSAAAAKAPPAVAETSGTAAEVPPTAPASAVAETESVEPDAAKPAKTPKSKAPPPKRARADAAPKATTDAPATAKRASPTKRAGGSKPIAERPSAKRASRKDAAASRDSVQKAAPAAERAAEVRSQAAPQAAPPVRQKDDDALSSREFRLVLIRHGVAAAKDEDGDGGGDAARALTGKGRRNTAEVAQGLRRLEIEPDLIYTSPYVRARQTAEIVAKATGYPLSEITETDALLPDAPALAILEVLSDRVAPGDTAVCAGHADHVDRLISALSGSKSLLPLKKSGVAVFRLDLHGSAGLASTLEALYSPRVLRLAGKR